MGDKPVLIIRPLRDEDVFLTLLDEASIPYKYIPIMQIQPLLAMDNEYVSIIRSIEGLDQFDQVIFISANAAEIGLPLIAERWPELPDGINFLAVGQQTAEIFSDFNYPVSFPQKQPNTEGLLKEIPQLQSLQGKSVLILRGGQGRQTLGEELIRRGATIEYCELYRRQIQAQDVVNAKKFMPHASCLVAHSAELLQAMGIPEDKHIPLVVPSDRIAQLASTMGYLKIQIAENALPKSMARAVQTSLDMEQHP